jgi:UDP-N-acetylmuramate dehydrogenase
MVPQVRIQPGAMLAPFTTLRLGGPAASLVTATDQAEIVEAVRAADSGDEPVLVLAGGSNVVIADEGFAGTVVLLRSNGIDVHRRAASLEVTVQAGHSWDDLVTTAVAEGWAGLECLSGIPGSTGATPIQNVGAYGQEVASIVKALHVLDRTTGKVGVLGPDECGFGYRTSVFKHHTRYVVLAVVFSLTPGRASEPLRFGELTKVLGVTAGGRAPLGDVRDAVLELRRGKGMVLDPDDPDTRSVGSFFTNPILDDAGFAAVVERAAAEPPRWDEPDGRVKTSAAWLIERAGFAKGYGRDGVAISGKHTLALTHSGAGSAKALIELAREIRAGVETSFGVRLEAEPVLVGVNL